MKKTAIAIAIAAAVAASGAAQAETTLYGSARVSIDYVDDDGLKRRTGAILFPDAVRRARAVDGKWDLFNNASRLGVRGSEDLGNGLSAIYQYEFGVDMTDGGNFNSNRPKVVGLRSERWGQISLGTQWSPYYNVIGNNDIFNSSRSFDETSYLGYVRFDNSVYYITPNWRGFTGEALAIIDGREFNDRTGSNKHSVDAYNLALKYRNGPFYIGGTYINVRGDWKDNPESRIDSDQWAISGGWTPGAFQLGIAYEHGDSNDYAAVARGVGVELLASDDWDRVDVSDGKSKNLILTGQYTFGNNIVRAGFTYTDPNIDVQVRRFFFNDFGELTGIIDDDVDADKLKHFLVGFQHNLSKRSRIWAEYFYRDSNDFFENRHVFSLGMRHDF